MIIKDILIFVPLQKINLFNLVALTCMLALLAQQVLFASTKAKTYINAIIMCLLANTHNIKNKNTLKNIIVKNVFIAFFYVSFFKQYNTLSNIIFLCIISKKTFLHF